MRVSQGEHREDKNEEENQVNEDSDIDDFIADFQKGRKETSQESVLEEKNVNDVDELTEMINQIDLHTDQVTNTNPTKSSGTVPKVRSKITYEDPDRNEWRKAMVIGRGGKASGKDKYWFNIKDLEDDSMKCVDFENISSWKNLNEEVLLCKNETFDVVEAKLKELENWKNNKVYNEVDNEGQNLISVRWVITEKIIDGITRMKARLVARGFEEIENHNIRKDSPTCGKENLRLMFLLTSAHEWKVNSMDIRAAFLQGKPIERDVYLKPPKEAHTKKIWKINITVYGLCDAPRAWYLSMMGELIKTGGVRSKYDNAIFYWHQNNVLQGMLSSHVDDFCWAGTEWFKENVIDIIRSKFAVSKEAIETFKYLGLMITQSRNGIQVHQKNYVEEIQTSYAKLR